MSPAPSISSAPGEPAVITSTLAPLSFRPCLSITPKSLLAGHAPFQHRPNTPVSPLPLISSAHLRSLASPTFQAPLLNQALPNRLFPGLSVWAHPHPYHHLTQDRPSPALKSWLVLSSQPFKALIQPGLQVYIGPAP